MTNFRATGGGEGGGGGGEGLNTHRSASTLGSRNSAQVPGTDPNCSSFQPTQRPRWGFCILEQDLAQPRLHVTKVSLQSAAVCAGDFVLVRPGLLCPV